MSNHGIRSYSGKKESGEQSVHSYQAVWMAHWGQTCKEASLAQNSLAVDHMSVEGNSVPATKQQLPYLSGRDAATDGCGSKEFTEVPMAGPADVPDKSVDVVSQRKERLEHDHNFPTFGINREVLGLSQNGGLKSHQQGVKLQPLWSSTDSEEKENALDLKNESSAETNTMDMDTLREDNPCDDEVSLSNKDFVGFKKLLASRVAAGCKSEEGSGRENAAFPSSHQSYVEHPSAEPISTDEKEPSVSKTQSLDAAFLLPDADGRMATNSTLRSNQSGSDPGSRWVKRLKISASESFLAHGTKTSKMEEATSSPKKFNHFSGKTSKRTMSSSEPLISKKSCEKKQMFNGNEQLPMKDGVSSSTSESIGKIRDELLSHSWIRRWCRNQSQAQKKKPEEGEEAAFVFCEPRRLKVSLDEIQKKQFPSIAAMALMGKAMNGFRPCEFRKRGTCVVWSTK